MLKVAIVGNIASGKSTVKNIIVNLGYKIIDTDEICHDLLDEKKEVIVSKFLNCDILDENKVSREKLGKLVFNNNDLKKTLESVLYPELISKINCFFEENCNEEITFVEIPLLYENNMQDLFDKVIFIYCDDEIRLQRLIKRNNYSVDYAKQRMNCQLSQDEKMKKSDYVIDNNSDVNQLEIQIKQLIEQIHSN